MPRPLTRLCHGPPVSPSSPDFFFLFFFLPSAHPTSPQNDGIVNMMTAVTTMEEEEEEEEEGKPKVILNKVNIAMGTPLLDPAVFYQALKDSGVEFFCGVPDSLLKDFCAYVTKTAPEESHFITASEGNAVAMCTGYHLATGKTGMVYLQNSGLGNVVNPLMSLAAPSVSSIPVLLLIGWRGEPGVKDEPQHVTQGRVTESLLETMQIPCRILPQQEEDMRRILEEARKHFEEKKAPFSLLVRSKTFSTCKLPPEPQKFALRREEALTAVVGRLSPDDVIVSTTGMLSRELFEYRTRNNLGHDQDFLTVGAMGHASSIALGVAISTPHKQVFALDGDGAVLMHMGVMATIGQRGPANFRHIIFNNGAHDSVGGQPTVACHHDRFSFTSIAAACGYRELGYSTRFMPTWQTQAAGVLYQIYAHMANTGPWCQQTNCSIAEFHRHLFQ
ncbi:phosphonopyruvate decarboxylase-like isoform X2 [Babylonia areolata]|uniref:phosphonopyruvate decarboxylase-like isoform X2 n=1 Tax=Babylonia areolata TaxID=304850 RepID=UPI003FCF921B